MSYAFNFRGVWAGGVTSARLHHAVIPALVAGMQLSVGSGAFGWMPVTPAFAGAGKHGTTARVFGSGSI